MYLCLTSGKAFVVFHWAALPKTNVLDELLQPVQICLQITRSHLGYDMPDSTVYLLIDVSAVLSVNPYYLKHTHLLIKPHSHKQ